MKKKRAIIIIPARYASTRLPGKMLYDVLGIPLVVRTYRQAIQSKLAEDVLIATDDRKIISVAENYGCKAFMTPKTLQSGSDRLAYTVKKLKLPHDIIVNVQGDEPLIHPRSIDLAIRPMLNKNPAPDCTTLVSPLTIDDDEFINPNTVKCVMTKNNFALYFSRQPIPYWRNRDYTPKLFRHIGLYAYRRDALLKFTSLRPSVLEQIESLEQLRLLEHDLKIFCVKSPYSSQAIDTEEDAQKVISMLRTQSP